MCKSEVLDNQCICTQEGSFYHLLIIPSIASKVTEANRQCSTGWTCNVCGFLQIQSVCSYFGACYQPVLTNMRCNRAPTAIHVIANTYKDNHIKVSVSKRLIKTELLLVYFSSISLWLHNVSCVAYTEECILPVNVFALFSSISEYSMWLS